MSLNQMEKDPGGHLDAHHIESQVDENMGTGDIPIDDSHHKTRRERRLVLKQDLTIVPLLSMCFFFAYLDRGNIGNARIMGFQEDLHLTDTQFFNCLMMFFVGYMVIELPAVLSLRIFRPPHVLGIAVTLFGVFATCLSATKSYGAVLAIRLLIGLSEAWVQTGWMYLSLWYKRDEIATRAAFYYISAPVGGAVSGLIAYGVDKNLDGAHGLHSWQWLFIVEGVPTIAWGIVVFICLQSLPERVVDKGSRLFRKSEERQLILQRTIAAKNVAYAPIAPRQIWMALKDPKTWLQALAVAAPCLGVAAFGIFLPTFIEQFGFSRLKTQLFSIIPYAFAIVSLPIATFAADRYGAKAVPMLVCFAIAVIGFILLLASTSKAALIVGTCLVAMGSYPNVVLGASWIPNTHAGYTKRATAWAVAQVFIQCWSIVGTQIYTKPPRFFKGHGTLLGLFALGAASVIACYWIMRRENRRRDAMMEEYKARGEVHPGSEESLEDVCDEHVDFRYVL